MLQFKLSATLSGHGQDVRAIVSTDSESIYSASRDASVRLWKSVSPVNGWSGSTNVESRLVFNSPTGEFINSLALVDREVEPLIASAGKDSMIYLSELLPEVGLDDSTKYQLLGHQGNVCSLHYSCNELASASWDTTAKIWDLSNLELKFDLQGHQAAVWDVKILGDNHYITCSADRTIRLWKGTSEVKVFHGHSDVVRKLLVLPGGETFASASNDGTIKVWDLKSGNVLKTLTGHSSFVYDLNILPNGDLISSGEDRTVRVWRDGQILQVITLPCVSVWCVAPLESGDFCAGCSDNTIRVFSSIESHQASEQELREFREAIENSNISEQSVENLKKTDIPGYEALSTAGKEEGAVIMVKSPEGLIEAHQWTSGEWIKIGDVVGSTNNSEKKEYGGKMWDYVFDVDVKDGEPPLKLPFNVTDNPYTAAQKFLADNDLPSSYTNEVVNFIQKNTEGVTLEQNAAPVENPYADKHARKSVETPSLKVIPEQTFIDFKDYVPERLVKGVKKFNAEQQVADRFTDEEIGDLGVKLLNMTSKDAVEIITQYIARIIDNWTPSGKLVAYDLLRIAVPRVLAAHILTSTEAAEVVLKGLKISFDIVADTDVALFTVFMKVLCNIVQNVLFVQIYVDPKESGEYVYSELFEDMIGKLDKLLTTLSENPEAKSHKFYSTAILMVSTFIYNLSANHIRTSAFKSNPDSATPIVNFIDKHGNLLIEISSESAYRLAIAYGNFKFASVNIPVGGWLTKAQDLYVHEGSEKRFHVLMADLQNL